MNEQQEAKPEILDASGRPARKQIDDKCPRCRAPKEKRVVSGGFGRNRHDVCSQCGYSFEELTVV